VKSSRIPIENKLTGLKKVFDRAPNPCINGSNLFTGDYTGGSGSMGMTVDNDADWRMFWTGTFKCDPPGPLPKGAMAIMIGESGLPGDPVELVPESIVRTNKNIDISWQRVHTAEPGGPEKKSQFAVLVVPKARNSQVYHDVFVAEEQRKVAEKLADDLKAFTEGTQTPIKILPITLIKKKLEFARF
jgi:hypothetical protein